MVLTRGLLIDTRTNFPHVETLAYNYLAIMASVVSNERAVPSSGITISKQRDQLKSDKMCPSQ